MPKWSVEASDEDDKRVAYFLADHRGDFSSKKELILILYTEIAAFIASSGFNFDFSLAML